MAKKERIEDLGRILEKINCLLKNELFENRPFRNKDFNEWFDSLKDEDREEYIRVLPYKIDSVYEDLLEIWGIALGEEES